MKAEIFETKVHFPKAGTDIHTECGEMYSRVMKGHAEVMMFNDVLVIMADKKDVHYIDILDTEFGVVPKKYVQRPDLVPDEPLVSSVQLNKEEKQA